MTRRDACSATRSRPVFPLQTLHARELLRVGGHKCRGASSGLAGEKDIIGADRPAHGFELGANSARGARIVFVEDSPLEWAAQKRLEPLSVTVLPRLVATPYHSSDATIDDSKITLSRPIARLNRRRTLISVPLINAMHAFVSSKYVVIRTRLALVSVAADAPPA